MISHEDLKKYLHYNPENGLFTWLSFDVNNQMKVGDIAGNYSNGYIELNVKVKRYAAHRLAWFYMTKKWPEGDIDHINHVRSDNRWCNLRDVTCIENGRNKSKLSNNKSGHVGVSWNSQAGKWRASIGVSGKAYNLGHYTDIRDAVLARSRAEELYGFHKNHGKEL